ncbi:V-type H-ATPase subunit C [Thalassiosira pseudonana CCMP1335]|uniref:V-type proton ATPase subunit C n=1 Tax=Thalassiosira pseudonana TaxID=35128 RepID=B5YNY5_THAPS|nr:V-type H-ATPase subunit C [Thalassiosira pseudonana CCMP1335]ACI65067.1 V-type H-ATPase subunit C [Thalassiosira pseudonana CCMP1335]
MFKLEVPSLMVGTLDSLMNLSDDLGKTDSLIESVVRKVEKSSADLAGKKFNASELTVGGVPPTRYVQQFAWDYAKYPNRRPLKELVTLISSGVAAIDEELKQLSTSYGDKTVALQDAKRKKGGNLMTVDLNDVLDEKMVRGLEIHDSEYLKSLFVAVGKGQVEGFEREVYGMGSPVVPGSLIKVTQDNDSVLYMVTILQAFSKVLKEKRYIVREFTYDPSQQGKAAMHLEQLQVEVDNMRSGLTRWCKTHYGEAFVAWMHIKVIRVFVESVLRYGLPVDFTAVLYKVNSGKDKILVDSLDKAFGKGKEQEDVEDDGEEYHDFVLIKFDP